MRFVCIDGELRDATAGLVSPFDHGLLVGDGVFETLRVYAGTPFAWRRHYERLVFSADALELSVPDEASLRAASESVLAAERLVDARLRITVTGGPAPLGSARGDSRPTVIVAASALDPWPPTAAVAVVPWTWNEHGAMAGVKTVSYAENVRALAYARERGAGEAVFANTAGCLCEATGSNVFVVESGVVRTPDLASGCLAGVTRSLVLELCEEIGVAAEEAALPLSALAGSDEAFLTSTTREIQPIDRLVDPDRPLAAASGPVSARLAAAFTALVARDLDP